MGLLIEPLLLAIIFLACSAGSATSMAPASLSTFETSTSNTTDHLALMSFNSFITSDPSQALASWGTDNLSVPLCRWRDVTCGMRGRRRARVVALDLPELGLHGTVAPELGNLTYLRRLHLPGNNLHGVLPPELGGLPDLSHLNLSDNSFQGRIPASLSNCTRLERLMLFNNSFQGDIPQELCLMRNLKVLNLGRNTLTGGIPSGTGGLVNLIFLNLEINNLTGQIPQEIGSLVKLVKVGLGHNLLSGPIPASFGNLSSLYFLSLYSTQLTGSIPPLQNLSSLEVLELSKNYLKGSIPAWLGNLSSLGFIYFDGNHLTGHIPSSLGYLPLLHVLSISNNNFSGPIPQSLGNLGALIGLHLDHNELEGPFPLSLLNISSLAVLDLQYNNLSGSIPHSIGNKLPNIQQLLTSVNQFHGIIPPSLCNASMLQWIQGVNNFFSGTIPECLGIHQKDLTVVTFAENQLETSNDYDWGFIYSLTNCSSLLLFDVGDNKLRGELPNIVGNLSTQLQYFVTNMNYITGKISEGIGNLVNLEFIEMNNNLFEGTIPASFGKLKKLNQLYLTNNNLSGTIPLSFGNLQMLTVLSLGGNALTGPIPPNLSNCLWKIPKEIFSISTLSDYLHLGHNFLTGSISPEVGNLKNLAFLDISNNKIFGEIPSSIGDCQSLEYLNTSGNYLGGKIPPSLDRLTGLLMLNLSHNNLSGSIPKFLGTMKGLATLDLSFNNLDGEVPTSGVFANATSASVVGNAWLCNGIPQLKLPPCSSSTTKIQSQKVVIIISICGAVVFMALVFAVSAFYHRRRKMKSNMQTILINEQYMRVSYAELVSATNDFASENLIGAGSFGSVYMGTMRINDQQVAAAVKVLNLAQRGASQSFVAECETLRCVRHRNLVKILTVCSSIDYQGHDFKALIYEFLPNGNLDKWLHQQPTEDGEDMGLDLRMRLQIAIDVASSLEYLHQHNPVPIIHCDLKPSNVLLDGEMVAHVGDFGLARFLHQDSDISTGWASMRGTLGYAAPEYGLGNEVSIQGDVYSYGILLLEMFTGKRPTESKFGEAIGLRKYVEMALEGRAANVIDSYLLPEIEDCERSTSESDWTSRDMSIACISSIMHIGVSCSAEMPMDRL
ncbi:hypothetical protein VPH35_107547 [Triticum aestivum]